MQASESEQCTIRTQSNLTGISTSLSPNPLNHVYSKSICWVSQYELPVLIMVHSLIGRCSNLGWGTTDDSLRDVGTPPRFRASS
jgi:hypothetical protein